MSVVLVTGAEGFIGRTLCLRLSEIDDHEVIGIGREHTEIELREAARRADFVFHLAGINRPKDPSEFLSGNEGFTQALCDALALAGNRASIIFSSSIQASADNPYGSSKRAAEEILLEHGTVIGAPVLIYRLPNVFGKWARPNYNSAVATFCHNVARGLPITINDPAARLSLVYVDDVVDTFLALLSDMPSESGFYDVAPVYGTTVGEVAQIIRNFPETRKTQETPRVGTGLVRALYSTYLSHLDPRDFAYPVPVHGRQDPRGIFVEMLKTPDAGQFSYFVAHPGVTRGDHYHHTKVEKFLVIAGSAHFAFRHVVTGEVHEVVTRGGDGMIVETIPGWTHNITNVGNDNLIVMLWANEIFDRQRPDTIAMKV
jgi:UDP-2-acetamido-2,6-beta-L-arabino-hexul-4-ose reductase